MGQRASGPSSLMHVTCRSSCGVVAPFTGCSPSSQEARSATLASRRPQAHIAVVDEVAFVCPLATQSSCDGRCHKCKPACEQGSMQACVFSFLSFSSRECHI